MTVFQIVIGVFMIILSVVVEILIIEVATVYWRKRYGMAIPENMTLSEYIFRLVTVTIWLLICMLAIVLMWTILFEILGVFKDFRESLYFSLVAFTTLGFGDVTLPEKWNLLSGFIAADGFVIFGLNTAIFMDTMQRLRPYESRIDK